MISIGVMPDGATQPTGGMVDNFPVLWIDGATYGQTVALNLGMLDKSAQVEYLHQLADAARMLALRVAESG